MLDESVWVIPSKIKEPEIQWPTAEELEAIRSVASKEGYSEGYEQGYKKATEDAKRDAEKVLAEQVKKFEILTESLFEPIKNQDEQITDYLAKITESAVKNILKKELMIQFDQIKSLMNHALVHANTAITRVKIKINPAQYDLISNYASEYFDETIKTKIIKDENITLGGVILETDYTVYDLTVESIVSEFTERFYLVGNNAC
jgi:flagellar assembly protein FliH